MGFMRCFKTYNYPLHPYIFFQPTRVSRVESLGTGSTATPKFIVLGVTEAYRSRHVAYDGDSFLMDRIGAV